MKKNNLAYQTDFSNIGARQKEYGVLDGAKDGEHRGSDSEVISKISVMQDAIVFDIIPFDRLLHYYN